MHKLLFALAAALPITAATASDRQHPPFADHLPESWQVDAAVYGDLTRDGREDAAIVARGTDPALVFANEGLGGIAIDTNPRLLLLLGRTADGWREIARSTGLLPPAGWRDNPCLVDPLEDGGLAIERGVLEVRLHYWLSCGSWGVTTRRWKFREQGGRMRLIGYDRLDYSRASGIGEETSLNYVTGRRKRVTGIEVIGPEEGAEPAPPPVESWDRIGRERHYLAAMKLAACENWEHAPSWC